MPVDNTKVEYRPELEVDTVQERSSMEVLWSLHRTCWSGDSLAAAQLLA